MPANVSVKLVTIGTDDGLWLSLTFDFMPLSEPMLIFSYIKIHEVNPIRRILWCFCQVDMRCVLCHENVRNTWNELVDVFIHSCTYTYIKKILTSVLNHFIHNLLPFLFYSHVCMYRVPCLYNAVQYNMTLHTPLQERRHNINQSIHPQKSLLPNGRAMWCLL